jgi:septal ring factor EnvC (AmiA/AmiB activator)
MYSNYLRLTPQSPAYDGVTALHWAAQSGLVDHIKLLLEHGAKTDIKSGKNALAWQYAKEEHVRNLLKDHKPVVQSPTTGNDDQEAQRRKEQEQREEAEKRENQRRAEEEENKRTEQAKKIKEEEETHARELQKEENRLKQLKLQGEQDKQEKEQKQEQPKTEVKQEASSGDGYTRSELDEMTYTKLKDIAKQLGGPKFFSTKQDVITWLAGKNKLPV